MQRPSWAPEDVDIDRPSAARVYDYYLGGGHNFAVDRAMAARAVADWPELPRIMQANRAFLRRAVRHLGGLGIDQFLDIGSGIPTVGNVHEVARRTLPGARVVYVDHEPIAVHHSRELLRGTDGVGVVQADVRDAATVLGSRQVADLLDLDRPLAVLVLAVLHFVPGDVREALAVYRRAMVPGSALAISHGSVDWDDPVLARSMRARQDAYRDSSQPLVSRDRAAITGLFAGTEIVEPGLVDVVDWRPDADEHVRSGVYGALGFVCDHPARP